MGYKLTSLLHLPFDDSVDMYVFSIGDHLWTGGLGELVHRNFDNIARAIGPNAIIVGALEDSMHGEITQKYLGKHHTDLKNVLPALLVTNAHPDHLSDDSLRLLIPLREAHGRYGAIDAFLADLAAFVRGDSDNLLNKLEKSAASGQAAADIVRVTLPVVPGFVAVNLNPILGQLRAWWKRRSISQRQP